MILVSLTKELTWAITANPENEHKKLIIPNFRGNERESVEIMLQPFVISMLPKNKQYKVPRGKLKKVSKCSIIV